jgi:hypothetical protein
VIATGFAFAITFTSLVQFPVLSATNTILITIYLYCLINHICSIFIDESKDLENQKKHNVTFSIAQYAFLDSHRVIVEDISHSGEEDRFYCNGRVGDGIMTVRSTYRGNIIRIY